MNCYQTETGQVCPPKPTVHFTYSSSSGWAILPSDYPCQKPDLSAYLAGGAATGMLIMIVILSVFISIRNAAIRQFGGEAYMRGWKDCRKKFKSETEFLEP